MAARGPLRVAKQRPSRAVAINELPDAVGLPNLRDDPHKMRRLRHRAWLITGQEMRPLQHALLWARLPETTLGGWPSSESETLLSGSLPSSSHKKPAEHKIAARSSNEFVAADCRSTSKKATQRCDGQLGAKAPARASRPPARSDRWERLPSLRERTRATKQYFSHVWRDFIRAFTTFAPQGVTLPSTA